MSIVITIVKAPESVEITDSTMTFDEQGGTLGRGKNNEWVLDDPERFLSSCHCQIGFEAGQYYLTDLSTNGTFFDGAPHPMGKGSKLPMNDGSSFILGDYEFSVSISDLMQNSSADPFASSMGSAAGDDIFSTPAPDDGFGSAGSPFAGGHVSSSESLFASTAEETDPLAALDKAQGGAQSAGHSQAFGGFESGGLDIMGGANTDPFSAPVASPVSNDPFASATHSDQANPLNQQISWPNSSPENSHDNQLGSGIPDDWDDDLMSSPAPLPHTSAPQPAPVVPQPSKAASSVSSPATSSTQTDAMSASQASQALLIQQKANEKFQAELELLKQQINAQSRNVQNTVSVDTRLIESMGLNDKNLNDQEITQINEVVGGVVREMVSGLMQVLGSRSTIKNEFRMNVTTIQPVENNPLKFSANVDDALENMFIKQGNAYKKPVEAVKESFDGIAEHQVAILAGIRAAFKGVIERFDPVSLEQRFAKQKKNSLIPGSQKAQNWELYLEYYNSLTGDMDNSFQYLFGDEFVQAYEDQLQKMALTRKAQSKDKI